MLNKGVVQINCFDGRNMLCKEKVSTNDSLVFDLKNSKIIKIMPLKAGAEVFIIGGAHKGSKGKIVETGAKTKVQIKNKNFEIQPKNLYVI